MLYNLIHRFAEKRKLSRVDVAVCRTTANEDRALVFDKLNSALNLIEEYAPETLRAFRQDAPSILVAMIPAASARYVHRRRRVELEIEHVLDAQASARSIACMLVHEAQHVRLCRLGFGYDEPIRGRIERLCFRAQRNFARRLPDAGGLVAEAEAWIEADLESIYSRTAYQESRVAALKALGCPDWFVKTMAWIAQKRIA